MNWVFYLKTTETCNLNCKHCFTNGTNGPKIFWKHNDVADWITRFRSSKPSLEDTIHFEFHGGEPFLVPVSQMVSVYDQCKDLWENSTWGATSNLVFKMYDEHYDLIKNVFDNRIGTSYDPKIRFANKNQYNLWRKNVKTLLDKGVDVKMNISVTKDLLNIEPIVLLRWIRRIGVQEFSLERLTWDGSANLHPEIFPHNIEIDKWFLKFHNQSEKYNARDWFFNEFFENVYAKFEVGYKKCGTFCRDCEEKIFTVNADGSLSGCPNSAPEKSFGNIYQDIEKIITNPQRLNIITEERSRNASCYSCPVFEYCGGDCHQLAWQDGICGAPKSLMMELAGISHQQNLISIKAI